MKYYLGGNRDHYELCRCVVEPTQTRFGGFYSHFIGPFKTKRAALFMLRHGAGNPHLQHVDDAERISRTYKDEMREVGRFEPVRTLVAV